MPFIRRRVREQPEPPAERRLPDLEFLALVRASLEELAPGVTQGAVLKGNSMFSPRGRALSVAPPEHGGPRHYDLIAWPDARPQPEVPAFVDCVVAYFDERHAADSWTQTSGACLLEMLERRERFADHADGADPRGVPGWHTITSGAVAVGADAAENRRLQAALLKANVLHSVADTFTADLEPRFFTGVKMFYGGVPGSMEAEVRIDGERHEAASAAMASLDLPQPTVFTAVRYYALLLLLPLPDGGGEPSYPSVTLGLEDAGGGVHHHHGHEQGQGREQGQGHEHAHGAMCGCGEALDPEHPGFELSLPLPISELSEEERSRRVRVNTGVVLVADGMGNFLKVRLPIRLDDGRTVVYLVWVRLQAPVIEEYTDRLHAKELDGHVFGGVLANGFGPWGEDPYGAPVVLGGKRIGEDGSIAYSEVLESSQPLLAEVLRETWPAQFVLGRRDPRLTSVAPD